MKVSEENFGKWWIGYYPYPTILFSTPSFLVIFFRTVEGNSLIFHLSCPIFPQRERVRPLLLASCSRLRISSDPLNPFVPSVLISKYRTFDQTFNFNLGRDPQINFLWPSRLRVGRRQEPILSYVPKNDERKNPGTNGLN